MSTHALFLEPSDVLFFRDGRPIEGSLAGQGAAWPLPNVVSGALHAALHRAFPEGGDWGDHAHRQVRNGAAIDQARVRRFGSLRTAGPFPVGSDGAWLFPAPLDARIGEDGPKLCPTSVEHGFSSLAEPLEYPVANAGKPGKSTGGRVWLRAEDYAKALRGEPSGGGVADTGIFDAEHAIGIGIDPATQTTGQGEAEGKIYSAHYLRLRPGWRMGVLASGDGKERNLLDELFRVHNGRPVIVVGGQQRVCTVEKAEMKCPLPRGLSGGFNENSGRHLVKWVLLTPAIWPRIEAGEKEGQRITPHSGGWLPNWVAQEECELDGQRISQGEVMLLDGPGRDKARRKHLQPGQVIGARLVSALMGKPIVVTGWREQTGGEKGGAKSTHLAVPAGAVYYFEARSAEEARKLANALNWHGAAGGEEPQNRRSTLLGEKGFGLGVCGTWKFWE